MIALITGITGFAGSHLAENLLAHGFKVIGTCMKGESRRNVSAIKSDIIVREVHLDDPSTLRRLVSRYKPQLIFHLAAMAAVGKSFNFPVETMQTNLIGTMNLYEALRDRKFVKKIVFVSSADIFGPLPPSKMPIKPDYPLSPVSPYGASKAAADLVSYQYYRAYGLPVVRMRAFNHTGPRQGRGFVIPDFCSQIAAFEKGRGYGTIKVGDLSAKRDISDVRDIVDGYRLAAIKGKAGNSYILASGKANRISSYLETLLSASTAEIKVTVLKKLLRPVEVPLLVGNITRARRELGYRPNHKIEDTLIDTLNHWRTS